MPTTRHPRPDLLSQPGVVVGPPVRVPSMVPRPPANLPPGAPAATSGVGGTQVLWVPSWLPVALNRIIHGHWAAGQRLKNADAETLAMAWMLAGGRSATGPRRVDLHLVLPKGQRRCDRDAFWKATLDGLVRCGALLGDSPRLCHSGRVTFSRAEGDVWGTMILLTEV